MSRISEFDEILDSVPLQTVLDVWSDAARFMNRDVDRYGGPILPYPFLTRDYASKAYKEVSLLSSKDSYEEVYRAMDERLCFLIKHGIYRTKEEALMYGNKLSHEDIVLGYLRDKRNPSPLTVDNMLQEYIYACAAQRAIDRCFEFIKTLIKASASPTKQTEEPAAARDELFQAFDDLCKDEKKRHEIMQYLPGRQGRKKKGVQTKVEYMNDLRKEICPALSSTEYFMKRFDDWARERLSQKTDKENR